MIRKLFNSFMSIFRKHPLSDTLTSDVGFFAINNAYTPTKQHESDAGYDVKAHSFVLTDGCTMVTDIIDGDFIKQSVSIAPGGRCLAKTGVWPCVNSNDIEIQVRPRSGLALKHGITVLNSPGTIDAGYRDEIGVILVNTSMRPVVVETGTRIAQLVICKLPTMRITSLLAMPSRLDRTGGFGSTGVK